MSQGTPKFSVGDALRDIYTNKVAIVTKVEYHSANYHVDGDPAGWFYSFDRLGWYLYPEEDLELTCAVTGKG